MKNWVAYVLGVFTGLILIPIISEIATQGEEEKGVLEIFDAPGESMNYNRVDVEKVLESGYAFARTDYSYDSYVLIIPEGNQNFFDNQEIYMHGDKRVQCVGKYKYADKVIPAVKILDVEHVEEKKDPNNEMGIVLFDDPGDVVSHRSFEVQEVLESGDAIAKEIIHNSYGVVVTSELQVVILAHDNSNFYEKQIVRAPKGKSARQVGNYRFKKYSDVKVIPVIDFK